MVHSRLPALSISLHVQPLHLKVVSSGFQCGPMQAKAASR